MDIKIYRLNSQRDQFSENNFHAFCYLIKPTLPWCFLGDVKIYKVLQGWPKVPMGPGLENDSNWSRLGERCQVVKSWRSQRMRKRMRRACSISTWNISLDILFYLIFQRWLGLAVCVKPALIVSLSSRLTTFPKLCQPSTNQKEATSSVHKVGKLLHSFMGLTLSYKSFPFKIGITKRRTKKGCKPVHAIYAHNTGLWPWLAMPTNLS